MKPYSIPTLLICGCTRQTWKIRQQGYLARSLSENWCFVQNWEISKK